MATTKKKYVEPAGYFPKEWQDKFNEAAKKKAAVKKPATKKKSK